MPYRVNACFEDFIKFKVNLDPDRVRIARTSRDNLLGNLQQLCDAGTMPPHYSEKNVHYGSFARRTKINPLDDIDLMVCFSACDGHYIEVQSNSLYYVKMQDGLNIYDDLQDEQGYLNSRKLINYIIKSLTPLRDYRKSDMHRNQEAVTLQLKSYEWNFDIVPCFYATDDFYLIPDGNGNWKKTDPRIDALRIATVDTQVKLNRFAKDLHTFVRLMKYWKQVKWGDAVSSYMFEQMILNYAESKGLQSDWQNNVSKCLDYLSRNIYFTVNDPKGMQGNLNTLDMETKKKLSAIAKTDYDTSTTAIIAESVADMMKTNHASAINHWHTIFGTDFKLYGQSYE
ncbi:MAG: hypothetical protein J6O49_12115 [Bacteroidaceae bacterium]|nr:hypothetical protein [Bacteroidaceae bacterium]